MYADEYSDIGHTNDSTNGKDAVEMERVMGREYHRNHHHNDHDHDHDHNHNNYSNNSNGDDANESRNDNAGRGVRGDHIVSSSGSGGGGGGGADCDDVGGGGGVNVGTSINSFRGGAAKIKFRVRAPSTGKFRHVDSAGGGGDAAGGNGNVNGGKRSGDVSNGMGGRVEKSAAAMTAATIPQKSWDIVRLLTNPFHRHTGPN